MTKADVIESVCNKVGFSKKESAEIVEMVFDTLKDTLERGEKIKLSGFGNFVVREKKSRVGRNPQTGQEIEIFRPPRAHLPAFAGPEERPQQGVVRPGSRLTAAGADVTTLPPVRVRTGA